MTTPLCQTCSKPTWNVDDYEEPLCVSCAENLNEAAYDDQQQQLMDGGGAPTLQEQHMAAWKFKQGLR